MSEWVGEVVTERVSGCGWGRTVRKTNGVLFGSVARGQFGESLTD